jgi:hypothetical protein
VTETNALGIAAPLPIAKADFANSAAYLALTARQRRWIDVFIETSDANRATREAYGATDDTYVAMFTRKTETSPRIIAALDLFFDRSPREKFLRDLQNDIAHSKGVAKIEARRLYAKMVFGVDGTPSNEIVNSDCKIGDIVLVNGVKHRVTAVDENGRPTDGEPL